MPFWCCSLTLVNCPQNCLWTFCPYHAPWLRLSICFFVRTRVQVLFQGVRWWARALAATRPWVESPHLLQANTRALHTHRYETRTHAPISHAEFYMLFLCWSSNAGLQHCRLILRVRFQGTTPFISQPIGRCSHTLGGGACSRGTRADGRCKCRELVPHG